MRYLIPTRPSFPPTGLAVGKPEDRLRRESSLSRVCGDMSFFRAAARKGRIPAFAGMTGCERGVNHTEWNQYFG
jgi:hypothetical protein